MYSTPELRATYRVKMYHLKRNVHFVIMGSVFDTPVQIHKIYDLKGSLIGRKASEKERSSGGVLKDQDLLDDHFVFRLGGIYTHRTVLVLASVIPTRSCALRLYLKDVTAREGLTFAFNVPDLLLVQVSLLSWVPMPMSRCL